MIKVSGMSNPLPILIYSVFVTGLVFGQSVVYAEGISVNMGSDDLELSIGGININIENEGETGGAYSADEPSYGVSRHSLSAGVSYVNSDLEGRDFSNRNLTGTNFSNADLTHVSFRDANLTGAIFQNATFNHCDLRGAIVDGANFTNADFGGSKVSSVDFSRAIMTNVDIDSVNIVESASLSSNNINVILAGKDEPSSRVNLDIRFAHDSDRVEAYSMKQISELSDALRSDILLNKRVVIEGHTDSSGSDAYNLDLSKRRAQRIINILVNDYGIELSRLSPRGFGENNPIYSNKTDFGKSVNRRVAVALEM